MLSFLLAADRQFGAALCMPHHQAKVNQEAENSAGPEAQPDRVSDGPAVQIKKAGRLVFVHDE